jgi:hypothetical protein
VYEEMQGRGIHHYRADDCSGDLRRCNGGCLRHLHHPAEDLRHPERGDGYAAERSGSNVVTLTNASGFSVGDYISFETVRDVFLINGVAGTQLTLDRDPPGNLTTVANTTLGQTGARAYLVKAITYRLEGASLQRRESTNSAATNEIGGSIKNLQVVQNYTGDSRLMQIILTAEYEDHEGTQRQRQYDAVVQLRN